MADSRTIKTVAALWLVPMAVAFAAGSCSTNGAQVQIKDPTDACTSALAGAQTIVEQAARTGQTPEKLARVACTTAVTAADLLAQNLNTGGVTFHVERQAPSMAGSGQGVAGSSQYPATIGKSSEASAQIRDLATRT